MGIEKIKEELLEKAAESEKVIISEANRKVHEISRIAAERIKRDEDEAGKSIRVQVKNIENRENAMQNLIVKKMIFEVKKEIMDNIYSKAFEKITDMPKKEMERIIKKSIGRAQNEIEIGMVYVGKAGADFIDKKFKINDLAAESGVICETSDGKVRVDYTFAGIFNGLKEKNMQEISKLLFG